MVPLEDAAARIMTSMVSANMARPIQPRISPAVASPPPLWPPSASLICFFATWPKITARRDPTPKNQRIPRTREAMASPFVLAAWAYGYGYG